MIKRERTSGIELLKIIAMLLIVIGHVTQTLYKNNSHFPSDYVLDYKYATTNIQHLLLVWMSAFGGLGNAIFLICSAWFLLDSKKINTQKILYMLSDVWIINMIALIAFKIWGAYSLPAQDCIKCLFPTTFALNWYITCYILLYLMHLGLNKIVYNCSQKELLTINLVTLTLYCGINYIDHGHFYTSNLVEFVVIYFAIAYIKIYLKNYCTSKTQNTITFLIGFLGFPALIIITNFLGLRISFFQDKLMRWGESLSPFLLLAAVSLFNLFYSNKFINKTINYISSMTLLIYILHENYLFRIYVRPQIWIYIHEHFGYSQVVLMDLIYSVCLLIASAFVAYLYKILLQKAVHKVSDKIHDYFVVMYEKICTFILRIQ